MRVCKTHRTSDEIFGPDPLAITRGFETEKYSIDFHDHDFYEINVVFAGTGYHYIENRKFDAAPGDVFVIPPGTLHAYENKDSQFNVFHLIAKNEFFAEFAHALQQISCFKLLMEIEPYLRRQNRRFFLSLNHKELLDFKGQAQIIAQLEGDTAPEAHGIRNVLLPAMTLQFASISEIIGGSVLVEQVFSYPGLGQAAVAAGTGSDVPLLMGITLITAAIVFMGNFIANLLYGVVDPRIRKGGHHS